MRILVPSLTLWLFGLSAMLPSSFITLIFLYKSKELGRRELSKAQSPHEDRVMSGPSKLCRLQTLPRDLVATLDSKLLMDL
jgi:hypothetical protein